MVICSKLKRHSSLIILWFCRLTFITIGYNTTPDHFVRDGGLKSNNLKASMSEIRRHKKYRNIIGWGYSTLEVIEWWPSECSVLCKNHHWWPVAQLSRIRVPSRTFVFAAELIIIIVTHLQVVDYCSLGSVRFTYFYRVINPNAFNRMQVPNEIAIYVLKEQQHRQRLEKCT